MCMILKLLVCYLGSVYVTMATSHPLLSWALKKGFRLGHGAVLDVMVGNRGVIYYNASTLPMSLFISIISVTNDKPNE